jgi:hypothetical protein
MESVEYLRVTSVADGISGAAQQKNAALASSSGRVILKRRPLSQGFRYG